MKRPELFYGHRIVKLPQIEVVIRVYEPITMVNDGIMHYDHANTTLSVQYTGKFFTILDAFKYASEIFPGKDVKVLSENIITVNHKP